MWRPSFRKRPGRIQQAVATKLGMSISRLQERSAAALNRKTAHLSPARFKLFLILFCILFGGTNLFVLQYSLSDRPMPKNRIPQIQELPVSVSAPKEDKTGLTPTDVNAVRYARHLMDSLSKTPQGRASVDSFLTAHPGFLDSLREAEKLIR